MFKEAIKTSQFIKRFKEYKNADTETARERAVVYLRELLGNEGGILLKILQYMGTEEAELNKVLNDSKNVPVKGIPVEEIRSILKENFGERANRITDIDEVGYYASIGQVNKALLDGEKPVAVKVQYPKIRSVLEEQLKLINLLPKVGNFTKIKKWGVEFSSYQEMIKFVLDHECDYTYEIEQLKRWKEVFNGITEVDVPIVYDEFCTDKVYLQEFITGLEVHEINNGWDQDKKRKAVEAVYKGYLHSLFHSNVIQGDTNFGNFLFQDFGFFVKANFIDLGQAVEFNPKFVRAIAKGLWNEIHGIKYSRLGLLVELGFDEKKLIHINYKVDLLVEILFEPFIAEYAFDLKTWKYKDNIDLLLKEDKWWFRSAGSTEFFLFMKSFLGLKNMATTLGVNIFFRRIILEALSDFDFEGYEIPTILIDNKYDKVDHGNALNIELFRDGVKKVSVSLPFNALFDIGDYLEEEVKHKIEDEHIDVDQIIQKALSDGGKPKLVYSLKTAEKELNISIINK